MSLIKKITVFSVAALLTVSNVFALTTAEEIADAQRKLEEAVREYTELTAGSVDKDVKIFVNDYKSFPRASENRARLGIHIGKTIEKKINGEVIEEESNTKGVNVIGLSKGGPAEVAGLQEGDIITELNGFTVTPSSDESALDKLMGFMQDVKPGDRVDVGYWRDGVSAIAVLTTDKMPESNTLVFDDFIDVSDFIEKNTSFSTSDLAVGSLGDEDFLKHVFISASPLGDAELVDLSPALGEYFNAESGLLVVRAPSDEKTQLRDGDVILSIDGRTPKSVSHASRILRSYDAGEIAKLEIKRKQRNKSIDLEITEKKAMSNFDFSEWHSKQKDKD